MKISIITPTFNSSKTILRTLISVTNVNLNKIELEYLIIDGKSTDDTIKIVQKFIDEYKGTFIKFTLISENDNGIYDAINKGINKSSGDIIGIINSDDYYETGWIEIVANSFITNSLMVLYGMIRFIQNDIDVGISIVDHSVIGSKMIYHPSTFISRSIYLKYGLYNPKYKFSSDYDKFLQLSSSKDVLFIRINEILSNHYLGGRSSKPKAYLETLNILYKYRKISFLRFFLKSIMTYVNIFLSHVNKT